MLSDKIFVLNEIRKKIFIIQNEGKDNAKDISAEVSISPGEWKGKGLLPEDIWIILSNINTLQVLDLFGFRDSKLNVSAEDISFKLPREIKYLLRLYNGNDKEQLIFEERNFGLTIYRCKRGSISGTYLILFQLKNSNENILYGVGVREVLENRLIPTLVWFKDIRDFEEDLKTKAVWFNQETNQG